MRHKLWSATTSNEPRKHEEELTGGWRSRVRVAAHSEDPEKRDEARAYHPHPPHPFTHFYTLLSLRSWDARAPNRENRLGGCFSCIIICLFGGGFAPRKSNRRGSAHQLALRLTAFNRKSAQCNAGAQSIAEWMLSQELSVRLWNLHRLALPHSFSFITTPPAPFLFTLVQSSKELNLPVVHWCWYSPQDITSQKVSYDWQKASAL